MTRLGIVSLAIPVLAIAQGFTFVIGNPVASQDFHFKTAAFVFRTEGCKSKPKLSASAEGINNNERHSMALRVMEGSKPGIYGVYRAWPAEGHWLVDLEGTCDSSSAAAIVPIGPNGFLRESARFFSHPASKNQIDASLKALSQGGNK